MKMSIIKTVIKFKMILGFSNKKNTDLKRDPINRKEII